MNVSLPQGTRADGVKQFKRTHYPAKSGREDQEEPNVDADAGSNKGCHQCGKNVMFVVEDANGHAVGLCLTCYIQFHNVQMQELHRLKQEMNHTVRMMEYTIGMRSEPPMFPSTPAAPLANERKITNVTVSSSAIGVLNTGEIQSIQQATAVLSSHGKTQVAEALRQLADAVNRCTEVHQSDREAMLQIIGLLSEELVRPPRQRRGKALQTLVETLGNLCAKVNALKPIWATVSTLLDKVTSADC